MPRGALLADTLACSTALGRRHGRGALQRPQAAVRGRPGSSRCARPTCRPTSRRRRRPRRHRQGRARRAARARACTSCSTSATAAARWSSRPSRAISRRRGAAPARRDARRDQVPAHRRARTSSAPAARRRSSRSRARSSSRRSPAWSRRSSTSPRPARRCARTAWIVREEIVGLTARLIANPVAHKLQGGRASSELRGRAAEIDGDVERIARLSGAAAELAARPRDARAASPPRTSVPPSVADDHRDRRRAPRATTGVARRYTRASTARRACGPARAPRNCAR